MTPGTSQDRRAVTTSCYVSFQRTDDGMSTVQEVVFGAEASGLLVLRNPRRGDDGEIWSVTAVIETAVIEIAVIETADLRAETRVATHYATHFDELIGFIVDLADCCEAGRARRRTRLWSEISAWTRFTMGGTYDLG